MDNEKIKQTASKISKSIELDILDRSGIGNALEEIDEEIRNEILEGWEELIISSFEELQKES